MADDEEPKAAVSWIQVAGSALAAVSSAVVLSTLGVAGTVVGAAVGSVVATIATGLYTRTLDASRHQVAAQAAALRRVTRARTELDAAVAARRRGEAVSETGIARAERELDAAEEVLAADSGAQPPPAVPGTGAPPAGRAVGRAGGRSGAGLPSAVLAQLSWKRVAVVAASVFLVAMVAITAFEVVAGRAVSELTGGSDTPTRSTVPGLGRDRPGPTPSEGAPADPHASEPPSDVPSEEPPSDVPSEDTSEDASEEPTPDAEPSAEPSATPSPSPSPSPGLTEVPTVAPSSTAGDAAGG